MSDQVRLVLSHLLLEVELAQKLHSKLLEEEQVLIHNDLTQLQAITDGKSEIITNYLSIKDARFSKLSQAGLNFDENQLGEWIESQAELELKSTWTTLIDILKKSKLINQTNGLIIHQLSSKNQRAISILLGENEADRLYGPSGQNLNSSGQQKITGY